MLTLLQVISMGFAVLSAGSWLRSAKVPLKLEYDQDEPFVLDLKVLASSKRRMSGLVVFAPKSMRRY